MDLRINGRNMEISDRLRQHITNRLGVVDRHLPNIARAEVEVAAERTRAQQDRVVVQVTLNISGTLLRAQQRAASANAAVNAAAEALDRQINRYKSRVYRSERESRGALEYTPDATRPDAGRPDVALPEAARPSAEPPPEAVDLELGRVGSLTRIKRFAMEPMTVEEAALQMERLDHAFYLFLDSETSQYSVIYRRGDANYGLIQPEGG